MTDTQLASVQVPAGQEICCPMPGWHRGRGVTIYAVLSRTAVVDDFGDRFHPRRLVPQAEVLVDLAEVRFRPDPESKLNTWRRHHPPRPRARRTA